MASPISSTTAIFLPMKCQKLFETVHTKRMFLQQIVKFLSIIFWTVTSCSKFIEGRSHSTLDLVFGLGGTVPLDDPVVAYEAVAHIAPVVGPTFVESEASVRSFFAGMRLGIAEPG